MKRNYGGMEAEVGAIVAVERSEGEEVGLGEEVQVGEEEVVAGLKEEAEVGRGGGVEVGLDEEAVAGLIGKVEVEQDGEVEVDLKRGVKGQEARRGTGDLVVERKENLKVEKKDVQEVRRDLFLRKL